MNKIDKVYFINLEHRKDRRLEIENELTHVLKFDRAERFVGIPFEPGIIGCTMSHIYLFRKMIQEGWETMMVFEDDAEILTSREDIDRHIEAFLGDMKLDILCIGNSCGINEPYNALLRRCFNTQTTSCYVIKKQFVQILLECYFNDPSEAMTLTEADPQIDKKIGAIDVSWTDLQQVMVFVMPKVRQLKQRASYSDITHVFADYKL